MCVCVCSSAGHVPEITLMNEQINKSVSQSVNQSFNQSLDGDKFAERFLQDMDVGA